MSITHHHYTIKITTNTKSHHREIPLITHDTHVNVCGVCDDKEAKARSLRGSHCVTTDPSGLWIGGLDDHQTGMTTVFMDSKSAYPHLSHPSVTNTINPSFQGSGSAHHPSGRDCKTCQGLTERACSRTNPDCIVRGTRCTISHARKERETCAGGYVARIVSIGRRASSSLVCPSLPSKPSIVKDGERTRGIRSGLTLR